MSDERDRIGIRTSPTLRSVVAGYGELSAATKALLIVGAVELGTSPQLLHDDIAALVGAKLDPALRTKLLRLLNVGSTNVEQDQQPRDLFQPVATTPTKSDDPYGDVGQEI